MQRPGAWALRALLGGLLVLGSLFLSATPSIADTHVTAVRAWPAPEYTRFTIESRNKIDYSVFALGSPDRLVIDLKKTTLGEQLRQLPAKLPPNDASVSAARVGQFKPGVTRVVLELKQKVSPSVFTLKPIGDYGHRLVIDIYPAKPGESILAQLNNRPGRNSNAPQTAELVPKDVVVVAIDAGHGGEDPGAIGRRGTYEKNVTLAISRREAAQSSGDTSSGSVPSMPEANSARNPSPIVLTIRPPVRPASGSLARMWHFSARIVPSSSAPISAE